MSARRGVPKASALPTGPETAKKADSRLDHVLLVGMGNMSINKSTAVPITNKKLSFAVAQNKPVTKVGLFDKKPNVVHAADIGVPMRNLESKNGVETEINDLTFKIQNKMTNGFLGTSTHHDVYELWRRILRISNTDQVADPKRGESIRTFYLYLLQVFAKALNSMVNQFGGDKVFAQSWRDGLKQADKQATDLLSRIVRDTARADKDAMKYQEAVLLYYDYVNRNIFQFFDQNTTPKLTEWLEARSAAEILDTMRYYQPPDSPPGV